jgi:hypothetical protein
LHNEHVYNLYTSANIIRIVKSTGIRRTRHATSIQEMKNAYKILSENLKERDHLEGLGIILNRMFVN